MGDINLFILKSTVLDKKSTRIKKNTELYDLELAFHGGNIAEMTLCIKNRMELSNAKIVLEDKHPGTMRRYFPRIEDLLDTKLWLVWLFYKVKDISSIYIDMFKDFYLLFL